MKIYRLGVLICRFILKTGITASILTLFCAMVAANLVGDDGAGWHYNGHSVAYDTRLKELLGFADNEQGTRIADLSMPVLKHYREALPLWRDTDRKMVRME